MCCVCVLRGKGEKPLQASWSNKWRTTKVALSSVRNFLTHEKAQRMDQNLDCLVKRMWYHHSKHYCIWKGALEMFALGGEGLSWGGFLGGDSDTLWCILSSVSWWKTASLSTWPACNHYVFLVVKQKMFFSWYCMWWKPQFDFLWSQRDSSGTSSCFSVIFASLKRRFGNINWKTENIWFPENVSGLITKRKKGTKCCV